MTGPGTPAVWDAGEAYEPYVGRWSRKVAREFLSWLAVPTESRWLDVGCGTGALSAIILERCSPAELVGVDSSEGFVAYARARVTDARARFAQGDALALPGDLADFNAAVAGLVLNFLPDPILALREMRRVVRPGGLVGVYVWDYADGMAMMRHFWDAAATIDPSAREFDEGQRFNVTASPTGLTQTFQDAELRDVTVQAITVPTVFQDFDDYWTPFLGGQGAAPTYVMRLDVSRRNRIRDHLRSMPPLASDGTIALSARAWAARGVR